MPPPSLSLSSKKCFCLFCRLPPALSIIQNGKARWSDGCADGERDGRDAQHVFYVRLVNDLAVYGIGLARRDRTLARLAAVLDQCRAQPATFACTLVPQRAPGAPRSGCA